MNPLRAAFGRREAGFRLWVRRVLVASNEVLIEPGGAPVPYGARSETDADAVHGDRKVA